ncbi:putative membrane protein [Aquimarina sp. EL_43]|uniref:Membrane protein n=1 Tax=Aquimarina atlantica TaxID=1317122 RepID=A0A023C194_9FLAO|nr:MULTISPECIES: CCC motif membrane protein [Aquimarina]EZH76042.1 membrane protein [Aquimarina atlantica]MBG6132688.1 putative membrane protein [Aquimarina sp. EL_35]MBG6152818.1 putative membrane protein [Aquimarina sp. EL_32]MBG6170825.1 putative membrane protein [Aquimarina sp. EL_43]
MEKQTLPNSTLILVFGILSILGCCCYGVLGIILAIVAIVLAKKATALYNENPELYTGYQNVKTGKILAIVGLILSIIYLIYVVFIFATVGYDGILDMQREMMEQYGG